MRGLTIASTTCNVARNFPFRPVIFARRRGLCDRNIAPGCRKQRIRRAVLLLISAIAARAGIGPKGLPWKSISSNRLQLQRTPLIGKLVAYIGQFIVKKLCLINTHTLYLAAGRQY